jgi:hypothetical protein
MARPSFTPAQRALQGKLLAAFDAGKAFKREMQQEKRKLEETLHAATQEIVALANAGKGIPAKLEEQRENSRKLLQTIENVGRMIARRVEPMEQSKRGTGKAKGHKAKVVAAAVAAVASASGRTTTEIDGVTISFPAGFKRPAGRPSLIAPFGRSAKGTPLAPWGLKADGTPKLGPAGRPPMSAAKAAKVAKKAAKKAAKVAYKAKTGGSIKTNDPAAPWGRLADGSPRKKPGRKPSAHAAIDAAAAKIDPTPVAAPAAPQAAPAPIAAPAPVTVTVQVQPAPVEPAPAIPTPGTLGSLPTPPVEQKQPAA